MKIKIKHNRGPHPRKPVPQVLSEASLVTFCSDRAPGQKRVTSPQAPHTVASVEHPLGSTVLFSPPNNTGYLLSDLHVTHVREGRPEGSGPPRSPSRAEGWTWPLWLQDQALPTTPCLRGCTCESTQHGARVWWGLNKDVSLGFRHPGATRLE